VLVLHLCVCVRARVHARAHACVCIFCFLKCSVIEHMVSMTATLETALKHNTVQDNLTMIKKVDADSNVNSLKHETQYSKGL
jgi:hypothetical protein